MLRSTLITVLSLTLATTFVRAALFDAKGPVINLDAKNFKKSLSDGNLAIVAFTAPWCGHCKTLTPEFTQAAQSLSPLIPFYNIDCDAEQNKPICGQEGIQGFPTIKVFPKGGKGASRDYQGERKAQALIEYMSGMVVDKVKKIRKVEDIEAVFKVEKPTQPHALLLHPSSPSIPLLWKVLATRLPTVSFGFLKDPNGEALETLGLKDGKDGVRVVYWSEQGEVKVYDQGPLKFEPLLKFFTALSTGAPLPSSSASPYEDAAQEPVAASPPPAQSNGVSDAELRAAKRKAAEAKWEEEERRDRLRREKRAREKAEREALEKQTEEQVHEVPQTEEALVEEGVLVVEEERVEAAASTSLVMDYTPTDIPEHDTGSSPPTPLEAEAESFDHGETEAKWEKIFGEGAEKEGGRIGDEL